MSVLNIQYPKLIPQVCDHPLRCVPEAGFDAVVKDEQSLPLLLLLPHYHYYVVVKKFNINY
jgi:hypothetical protein